MTKPANNLGKKVQVRLDAKVLAQLFAEMQVSRAFNIINDFKNHEKHKRECIATVELMIANGGKRENVWLESLRQIYPCLGWADLSSANTRKYQRYVKHWKDTLPENVQQLEDILRTLLHT